MAEDVKKKQKNFEQVLKHIASVDTLSEKGTPKTRLTIDYVYRSGEMNDIPWEHQKLRVRVIKLDYEGNPKQKILTGKSGSQYTRPDMSEIYLFPDELAHIVKVDMKPLVLLRPVFEEAGEA